MKKFFKFKEVISVILAVLAFVYGFGNLLNKPYFNGDLLLNASGLNIFILLIALFLFGSISRNYFLSEKVHGEYTIVANTDLKTIEDVLKVDHKRATYLSERTSALVGQLIKNFPLFLWPLILFYGLNVAQDSLKVNPQVIYCLADYKSLPTYMNSVDSSLDCFWYVIIGAFGNIFNFISGIGLFVCFNILYQKTLDADNKSALNFHIYYFLLAVYILGYLLLFAHGLNLNISIKDRMLYMDLFCGLFNGIGMILFFNRLLQVLFFFKRQLEKEGPAEELYFFIAVILFPIYASVQIFFSVFDTIKAGNPDAMYIFVKGGVFFVCFIGKLFLIVFLYAFLRTKWLHAAIITLLHSESIPFELAQRLLVISDSIQQTASEPTNDIIELINGGS